MAHRGGGSEGEATAGLASGLQASATKALAVCGVAVAGTGGAYCAVNGVPPGALIPDGGSEQRPVDPAEDSEAIPPAALPDLPQPGSDEAEQNADSTAAAEPPELNQAQQSTKELGFEQVAPSSGGASSGGEFGGGTGQGGGGGSSGGSGGGFGIE
jgi:hypothetical protein